MARPIRLTYLITDLDIGGVPLHLHRLATRLPRGLVQVRVISLADKGPVGQMLADAGIRVMGCGARGATDLRALWRLWRLLRSEPADVLHALLFHANIAARIVGPLAGIPARRIICEIQTVERDRKWHLSVDNLTCRQCRFEVGNSPSVIEHLTRQAHIPRSRLRCEYGAVDVETIASAQAVDRHSLGVGSDEQIVIWTGRLDPVKGFEEMLRGFAMACRGKAVRFLLVGEGPYRSRIEEIVDSLGLTDQVTLLGQRADVPKLLKAADLYLFGSRTEGLPNALAEAMAAGLPIVATRVPGSRDLLRHGETGWLVEPGSAVEIGKAVESLLADGKLRRAQGHAAARWVSDSLNTEDLASRWLGIYRSCR